MSDLIRFLNARADESEAGADDIHHSDCRMCSPDRYPLDGTCTCDAPGRTRREVEARRAIIRRCERQAKLADENCMEEDRTWVLWPVLRDLAAVDRDHPDYQPKWARSGEAVHPT